MEIVNFYNKEVKRTVEVFTAMLEPIFDNLFGSYSGIACCNGFGAIVWVVKHALINSINFLFTNSRPQNFNFRYEFY
jgi:hypothetical protein